MQSERADSPEIAELTGILREGGAIDRAYEKAQEYATAARCEIERFADNPFRQALLALPDRLIFRDR